MDAPNWSNFRRKLPSFIQSEATECGLACLAMVAAYHGHKVNLAGLRRTYPTSSRGASFKNLIEIGDHLGLQARPLKLEMEHVHELKVPCILHWDLNHFVVLRSGKSQIFHIHDPAFGEKKLNAKEFAKHFTGIALELQPKETFKPIVMKQALKIFQLFQGVIGLKRSMLWILCLSLMLLVMTLSMPLFMQIVMDDVLVNYDAGLLPLVILGLVAITLFKSVTSFLRGMLTLFIGNALSYHASTSIFRHLLDLPLKFYERRHMGDIVSRFRALDPVRSFLTEGLVEAAIDGLMMIFMLAFMLVYSLKLSFVALVAVVIYGCMRFAVFYPFRRLTEESIVSQAAETSNFMESIRGIQSIKLYGGQIERHSLWQNLFTQVLNAQSGLSRFRISFQTARELLFGLERALILYLGVNLVFDNQLSAGMLIAFLSYKDQFAEKVAALVENFLQYKMLDVHLDRLSDIVLQERERTFPSDESNSEGSLQGSLQLRSLGYRYDKDSPWLFRDLQLDVEAGESIAIIGPSGCGKTTLLKIMVGLLDSEEGKVLVDGKEMQICKKLYQNQLATVMQDDHLLSGTITENIAFFDAQPDMERVVACAAKAAVHADIMNMPMRYNSLIGDMGSSLSGGQKQRLLLARALYRNPRFLFLDEATSHLDGALESAINDNIRSMNITRIIIAHRRETILSTDRIYILSGGQLIQIDKEEFAAGKPPRALSSQGDSRA